MKSSELLKKTKKVLWNGTGHDKYIHQFICLALNTATPAEHAFKKHAIKDKINKLLFPHKTLESWLGAKGIDTAYDTIKLQKTRQRWLNHLIKHYKSQGD